ncbi:MAG: SagB family peptide dehydrogenase [Pseudomonadota bacterium]
MTRGEHDASATERLCWRWRSQVDVDLQAGTVGCNERGERLTLSPSILPHLAPLIDGLSGRGLDDDTVRSMGSQPDAALLYAYLARFLEELWIEWVFDVDGATVAVFTSLASGFRPEPPRRAAPDGRLSRFTFLRFVDGNPVLSSSVVPCRAELSDRGVRALLDFQTAPVDTATCPPNEFGAMLARFGLLECETSSTDQLKESWEFADALFHASSTRGRDVPIVGLNRELQARFAGPVTYEANAEEQATGPTIALAEVARPLEGQSAVLDLMGRRRSCREWSSQDMPLEDLSVFLSHVARGSDMRPPMAGGIRTFGWYLVAGRVDGLADGVYRYNDEQHGLETFKDSRPQADAMLAAAAASMNRPEQHPHALILLTVRLPDLSWRYSGMAYRLALLDAGVVFHAMYLQATDMGLGGCALGTVDPRPFEAATKTGWPAETPIVAFALGVPA